LDESEIARYIALGEENARIIDLATQHCRRMRFAEADGRGMLEEYTGLPLNSRRVECPVAIGNMSGMRLDHVALEYYEANCRGCDLRQPTGRLPNLETEYNARQAAARAAEVDRAEHRRQLGVARTVRVERRRGLRATADPAVTALLDDIDIVDRNPEVDRDPDTETAARRRLTALANRAGDRFTVDIIEELFDVVATVGVTDLLEPLRHLTARHPEFAPRLVRTAVGVLEQRPDLEAGRCLTDHPTHLQREDVTENLVRSLVVMAGSKTSEDYRLSGPVPVVTANDPTPLRDAVELDRETVSTTLRAMLPRPQARGLLVPPTHQPTPVSDSDRYAAAGAIERLVDTHLNLAVDHLPDLVVSLAVPADDPYDLGTLGSAERALGRMLVRNPADVIVRLENAGRRASEAARDGLLRAVRHAIDMVNTDSPHRTPDDPVVSAADARAVYDASFAFLIARTDESWGHAITFAAAATIETMGRWHAGSLDGRMDTLLGAFLDLTRHRLNAQQATSLATPAPDSNLTALENFARRSSLGNAAGRLLNAVASAAHRDPVTACRTVCTVITNERDSDLGADAVMPLLRTLGDIGRTHGKEPGVLQAILPTLHTYLVDADPGARSAALEAWTEIGSRHQVPTTVNDALAALVSDPYLVVVDAVLDAACRLTWIDPSARARLALHALTVVNGIEVRDHLDTFLAALSAARRHLPDLNAVAETEKRALARVPPLMWHQATKVVEQPWQPDARVSPALATMWLALAPRSTYGLRQHDEAEEALNGLLDCGAGLLDLPTDAVVEVGAGHAAETHYGAMEYAEVLARAERRGEAAQLLGAALARIPDDQAHSVQRALTVLALACATLQAALNTRMADTAEPGAATAGAAAPAANPAGASGPTDHLALGAGAAQGVADVAAAVDACCAHTGDDRTRLNSFVRAAAVRASLTCLLLDIATPPPVLAALADTTGTSDAKTPIDTPTSDPADVLAARAVRLRELSKELGNGGRSTGTATHTGLVITAKLLDCVAHLLDAEAADLNADLKQAAAHRTAATRRAAAIDLDTYRDDDPLLQHGRRLRALLVDDHDSGNVGMEEVLAAAAALPAPMLFIRAARTNFRGEPWQPPAEPNDSNPTVAVALVSIDDKLLTGPSIVDPNLTHTLTLRVQTDPWPSWVQRLDAEMVSTLDDQELERPRLSWQRHQHTGDPETFEGTGSLHVRYGVPTSQQAPPVLVQLTWRGVDADGNPKSEPLDVAGHREFRVRPYDPARDAATQYEVFDEHLLGIYEQLAVAGYPHAHLHAFARLLNAISRAGLAMTWNKNYRRGRYVKERTFHDDLHAALLADPTLEGRVERATPRAHGYLDTRHDKVTAELKVARGQPVTPEAAPKYIGQPTQYAAADGVRLSILVILDMSPKVLPIGTPENYLFVLNPQQHGMTDPHSPSVVVTLVVNGNLPVPSSWSRRKTPTYPTPESEA
jgi:hypothetical protein